VQRGACVSNRSSDGRGPHGDLPPNNWLCVFGGPAWTRVKTADGTDGQWYLHLFAAKQPDFNWENPQVRTEFENVLRFWLDRGVDGFRVDVANALIKAAGLPDWEEPLHLLGRDQVTDCSGLAHSQPLSCSSRWFYSGASLRIDSISVNIDLCRSSRCQKCRTSYVAHPWCASR
jgi:Alpha amylase, catalytic domain